MREPEELYKVIIHKNAARAYRRCDARMRARLDKALEHLQTDSYWGPNIKRLVGELADLYRYRVGDWRILYEIHAGSAQITRGMRSGMSRALLIITTRI